MVLVNRQKLIILFISLSAITDAQQSSVSKTSDVFGNISKTIASEYKKSVHFRNCDNLFFSIRFKIDTLFRCKEVTVSRGVEMTMSNRISDVAKNLSIDWQSLLGNDNPDPNGFYWLLLPIQVSHQSCNDSPKALKLNHFLDDIFQTGDRNVMKMTIISPAAILISN